MTQSVIPHTRLIPPRPPECNRATPPHPAAAAQGARLEAQNHTLRDTVVHYRKDTMERIDGERRKQITITGKGWAALAFTAGAVMVAVAWWIIDTAILTSPVGPDTTWFIDVNSLRPWALALWIGSNVTGLFAGIAYERMPVTVSVSVSGGEVPYDEG